MRSVVRLILGSGVHPPISLLCLTTGIPALPTFITLNIKKQCPITSLPAWYTVRNKRHAVTPNFESSRPSCGHRCLYRCLCYLGLRPPVGYFFEGRMCPLTVDGFQEKTRFHVVSAQNVHVWNHHFHIRIGNHRTGAIDSSRVSVDEGDPHE
jgi:hypothetical protein